MVATRFMPAPGSERPPQVVLDFIRGGLARAGCQIVHVAPERRPLRVSFETPQAERLGLVVYGSSVESYRTRAGRRRHI